MVTGTVGLDRHSTALAGHYGAESRDVRRDDWSMGLTILCGLLLMLACYPLLSAGFVYEDANRIAAFPGWNWRPNRFLSDLTWALQAGQPAWAFHVVNLIVHSVNAVLVALLARRWGISAFAGAIFLLHPLPLFAAGYLQGRPDLLMTLGVLTAVLGCQGGRPAIALLGTAIAVFSKEAGIVVLPLLFLTGQKPWLLVLGGLALSVGTYELVESLWRHADVTAAEWARLQASALAWHLETWLTAGWNLSMLTGSRSPWWLLAGVPALFTKAGWWIVLALSVRFLVPTIGTPISAHQMYLASVGLALLSAQVFRA